MKRGLTAEEAARVVNAPIQEHIASVVCTVPGNAHKARNCTSELCQQRGLCQGTTTVKQAVSLAETAKRMEREGLLRPAQTLPYQTADKSHVPQPKDQTPVAMLPTDKQARKDTPIGTGVLDYFPAALAEVARCSKAGNDQHNPGQPLHWARGKSQDHFDAMVRHGMERGTIDTDGIRHSAKAAWRALANLQQELEDAGLAPVSRGSKVVE